MATVLAAGVLLCHAAGAAQAADITVLVSQGAASGVRDLAPAFERATGHKVIVSQEVDLAGKVNSGAPADVVVAGPLAIDDYVARGKVVAGTRVDFAMAGVGVAVKTGAPRPDISTPEAFKRAMLNAKSIAYSRGGSGQITHKVMEQLGIVEAIKDKTLRAENVPIAEIVARGEAEIGMHQINVILPVAGADYVGPLPPGLQDFVQSSLGVLTVSTQPDAARAFERFASAPENAALIRKSGMEPWGR